MQIIFSEECGMLILFNYGNNNVIWKNGFGNSGLVLFNSFIYIHNAYPTICFLKLDPIELFN